MEWERCARIVAPASRGVLDNLRLLSRAFASGHASGHARADPPLTGSEPYAGRFVRRFLGVMVAVAAVEVAGGLAPLFIWYAYFWETPPLERFDSVLLDPPPLARLSGYLYLFPQMYAPAFLWAFARECPRVHRRSRLDDLARRMVPVSVAAGVGFWVTCMVTYAAASAGYWPMSFFVANYLVGVVTQLSALTLVVSRPERAVGTLVTDPLVISLVAACGVVLLLAAGRERLLMRLDAWVVPETTDQRPALAAATAALAQAGRIETIGRTVSRTINRSCGSPATLLVAGEGATGAQDLAAWNNRMAPLARASSIVHMLEKAGGSVRVHPSDPTSVFELLPPDESAWVVETGADAVVAVIGPGAEVTGILVVGQRFDDRIVRSVDVPFLEAVSAAAGLAIARLRSLRVPVVGALDGPPAPASTKLRNVFFVNASLPRY